MASYTANYGLHQWEASDNFLRTDFNTDLQKIDAALGEKGNARIASGTYVGAGVLAATMSLSFPFPPKLVMVSGYYRYALFLRGETWAYSVNSSDAKSLDVVWTEDGLEWELANVSADTSRDLLNYKDRTYSYLAIG